MNRDKLRGITLAALMVLSVFAVAVTPATAAGDTEVSVNPGDASVDVGSTQTFDVVVENAADGVAGYEVEISLTNGSAADITSVTPNGGPLDGGSVDYGANNDSVTVSGALTSFDSSSPSIVTVEVTGDADGSTGVDVNVEELTDGQPSPYTVTNVNSATLTVGDSGGGDPGTDPEPPSDGLPDGADDAVSSNNQFWKGQQLYFQSNLDGDLEYDLYQVTNDNQIGDFVTDIVLNEDGSKILNTGSSNYQTGSEYVIVAGGDAVVIGSDGTADSTVSGSDVSDAKFSIFSENFNADIESADVTQGDSTTATLTSRRGGYMVNVSSENLDDDVLTEMFGATTVDVRDTDEELTVNVPDDVEPGTYTVTFEVTDTGASASVDISVAQAAEPNIAFGFDNAPSANQGEILEIPLTVENTDSAQVRLGSNSAGYNVTATVTDGNDDGTVVLELNTYTSGLSPLANAFDTASDDDSVSVSATTQPIGEPIDAGTSYDLTLIDPDNGNEIALNSFLINERETGVDMAIWKSPRGTSFDNASDITSQVGSTVTPGPDIAAGDVIVHQISVQDIQGLVAANQGDTGFATLNNLIQNNHVSLSLEQANPGPNQDAKQVDLAASSDGISVFYSGDSDELFVVVDSGDVVYQDGTSPTPEAEIDVMFEVTDPFVSEDDDDGEATENSFTIVSRTTSLMDADAASLNAAANQTISGETTVAPGTTFSIEVRRSPVLDRQQVTVGPNGSFSAQFDLSRLSAGDELQVTLSGAGESARDDYTLVEPAGPPTASVSISDQTSADGQFITVDSVEMSEGGFVAIHLNNASGTVVGVSGYITGSAENVPIRLSEPVAGGDTTLVAMPHLDDNNNQQYDFPEADAPYVADGSPVTDDAVVTVPVETTAEPTTTTTTTAEPTTEESTTAEPTTEESTTAEPTTEESTSTEEPEPMTTTSEGDGPGFTVALALVALVAAALLAVRRNN